MSMKIKIVWAFIDKDPETGNHLLSALHIFVVIFYHELENKNFWIHTHTVTIAIHPSIVGTDPIWFFFMNDILAESFTILNWTNMAKMPIIMLKSKYEFALINLLAYYELIDCYVYYKCQNITGFLVSKYLHT